MQGLPLTEREVIGTFRHAVNRLLDEGLDRAGAIRLVARRYDVPPIAVVAAMLGGDA